MVIPTAEQYQEVIKNRLSPRQIKILQTIYRRPNSAANAVELAEDMGYKSFQGANLQIGAIGQAIQEFTGVELPTYEYKGKERPAYYMLIGNDGELGWRLWEELKKALENLGLVQEKVPRDSSANRLPTEVSASDEEKYFHEGKVTEVFVNRYERNPKARAECIRHYGAMCQGCGFDFGAVYGTIAQGFIHVHHVVPLSEIGKSYLVDPVKDLVPLCANCHSVVHLSNPTLSVEELQRLVKNGR